MTGSGVTGGDCAEALRRASARPDLEVDKLPEPVAQSPRPFLRMPRSVRAQVDRRGAVVKADVVIDTLGRAVMSTFTVVESTPHAWLGQNIRSIIPRWRFTPAELAGCKVPRVYKFSATAPKRG
jgi:outer membrane biosynthesis protein TonB